MYNKIQIYEYLFILIGGTPDLGITTPLIGSSYFTMPGKLPEAMDADDIRQGQIYQQEIHNGKWDWIIFRNDHIRLLGGKINITLSDPVYDGSIRYGGGSIQSCLKETCPHCKDSNCDFECLEAHRWSSIKDSMSPIEKCGELEGYRNFNFACDGIESMIMGHAIAGVNIESAAYLEGIEAALDAMGNNL